MSMNKTCAIASWISFLISMDIQRQTHAFSCNYGHFVDHVEAKRAGRFNRALEKLIHGRVSEPRAKNVIGRPAVVYFCVGEATSFWKRGSFRNGSNIGSSRSSAGVSGAFSASAPS